MNKLIASACIMFSSHTVSALELLVPAYFYPVDEGITYWQALADAAPDVAITAILNPDSGPGAAFDGDYAAVANAFQAAGGRLIGYVHTGYGARSEALVRAEIDRYYAQYGVDGIFLDEVSNQAQHLDYYQSLHAYIKGGFTRHHIVANPGTQTPEAWLATADVLVTFESPAAEYAGYVADEWTAAQDAARFAHLVYDVPDADAMRAVIDTAIAHNVGHVYVTNDRGDNPWDTLPSYWAAETARVAAVPEPSAWAGLLAGLALIATRLTRRPAGHKR
ncbi:MAG: PEP-CTERM sorting domain-containing protein [Methyloversatilis sp. 12-65-5]|nr:MAG: PEP-CTERM sorting domain-containing protein [Methyloversatilis sp. 12-65-5]